MNIVAIINTLSLTYLYQTVAELEGINQGIRSASVMARRLSESKLIEAKEEKVEETENVKELLRHSRHRKGSGKRRDGVKKEEAKPEKKSKYTYKYVTTNKCQISSYITLGLNICPTYNYDGTVNLTQVMLKYLIDPNSCS